MKIGFLIFSILFFISPSALSDDNSCFPIGMARHDRDCYDFDTKVACLSTTDIYSCGWGKRREEPLDDDDVLICDNSRCPNLVEDEPEDEEE